DLDGIAATNRRCRTRAVAERSLPAQVFGSLALAARCQLDSSSSRTAGGWCGRRPTSREERPPSGFGRLVLGSPVTGKLTDIRGQRGLCSPKGAACDVEAAQGDALEQKRLNVNAR